MTWTHRGPPNNPPPPRWRLQLPPLALLRTDDLKVSVTPAGHHDSRDPQSPTRGGATSPSTCILSLPMTGDQKQDILELWNWC